MGKTSLVVAVSEQARDRGFRVVTGHCLDIDTGVPLGPVREALHEVVLGRSDATLPPVTRRLAPLLRGHQAPGEAMSTDALDDVRSSLIELAHEGPLMLVLEDMHWADRSTQDAAVMLSHTMRGPFVLMLTYRTEDVTRQHPLRHSLAEIGRAPGTRRIDLGPLDEEAIAGIVEAVTGAADRHLAISILDRSGGNPLFAEELLAGSDKGLPEYLNALLLARIDALTPGTRELIRLASVGGSRIQTTLLGQATHLSERKVDAGLREALDANVVSRSGRHLQFRHELVREAAYQDLLPDERVGAHIAFAGVLQSRVEADDSPEHRGPVCLGLPLVRGWREFPRVRCPPARRHGDLSVRRS